MHKYSTAAEEFGRPLYVTGVQRGPTQDRDPARRAIIYFFNNRHRMRYPEYRAQGYQIGSGGLACAGHPDRFPRRRLMCGQAKCRG